VAIGTGQNIDPGWNAAFITDSLACDGLLDAGCHYTASHNESMEKVVARHPLNQQPRDTEYWLSRSPSQRLDAVEILRHAWLETHPDTVEGLQRVCRVTKHSFVGLADLKANKRASGRPRDMDDLEQLP